jgi:hypothetical protein
MMVDAAEFNKNFNDKAAISSRTTARWLARRGWHNSLRIKGCCGVACESPVELPTGQRFKSGVICR